MSLSKGFVGEMGRCCSLGFAILREAVGEVSCDMTV